MKENGEGRGLGSYRSLRCALRVYAVLEYLFFGFFVTSLIARLALLLSGRVPSAAQALISLLLFAAGYGCLAGTVYCLSETEKRELSPERREELRCEIKKKERRRLIILLAAVPFLALLFLWRFLP